jgi:hypothetical protein
MALVALATGDGKTIGHLGAPGSFHLYRFDDAGGYTFIGQRMVPFHPQRERLPCAPPAVALLLADVQVILACRVEPATAAFLKTRGILAFGVQGTVDDALQAYSRRGRVLDALIAHVRKRSRRSTNVNHER